MQTFRSAILCLLVASGALAAGYEGYGGGEDSYEGYGGLDAAQDKGHYGQEDHHVDYHAHPKYSFDYSVKDPHTGDQKEHWETRDGDKVKGSYSLVESDGTKRVVEYEADHHNGFNAIVHKIGTPKEQPAHGAEYAHEYSANDYAQSGQSGQSGHYGY